MKLTGFSDESRSGLLQVIIDLLLVAAIAAACILAYHLFARPAPHPEKVQTMVPAR